MKNLVFDDMHLSYFWFEDLDSNETSKKPRCWIWMDPHMETSLDSKPFFGG
jgi:hypothetical protein